MIRSLKARIELIADQAIAQLQRLNADFDAAAGRVGRLQHATTRYGEAAAQAVQQATSAFATARTYISDLADAIERYRIRLSIAAAAGIAAMRAGTQAAMAAESVLAALRAVYGDLTSDIMAWARNWAHAHGYAASSIYPLLAQSQALLLSMDLNARKAADYSKRLVQLAADLAAFAGVPIEQAMDAVTRALAGQTRALVNLGIVLRQEELRREARRLGYRRELAQLTETQRAHVVLSALMRNAAHIQGYLSEHMELGAVRMRRLREAVRELREEMGRTWQNIAVALAGPLAQFIEWLTQRRPFVTAIALITGVGTALAALLAQVGWAIWGWRQLTQTLIGARLVALLRAPFAMVGSVVRGLGSVAIWAARHIAGLVATMARVAWAGMVAGLRGIGAAALWVGRAILGLGHAAAATLPRLGLWLAAAARHIWTFITAGSALLRIPVAWLATGLRGIGAAALWAAQRFVVLGRAAWTALARLPALALAGAKSLLTLGKAGWIALVAHPWVAVVGTLVVALGGLAYGIYRAVRAMGGFREAMRRAFETVRDVTGRIGRALAHTVRVLTDFARQVGERISGVFRVAWTGILRGVNVAVRVFMTVLNRVLGWIPGLGDKIRTALTQFDPLVPLIWAIRARAPELAAEVEQIADVVRAARPELHGRELLEEFIAEIRRTRPELEEAIEEFIVPIRLQLEARSPPRAGPLREIGEWGEGLMREYADALARGAQHVARALTREVLPGVASAIRAVEDYIFAPQFTAPKIPSAQQDVVPTAPQPAEAVLGRFIRANFSSPLTREIRERHEVLTREFRPIPLRPAYAGGPAITVNVGGIHVHVSGAPAAEMGRRLGEEIAATLVHRVRAEVQRWLVEALGAEETLHMPDELE